MAPWYKTIVGGSSKKLKGSKSKDSLGDGADESGPTASSSTPARTASSQPVSIPATGESEGRARQGTATSDDEPMPAKVLGSSPSHAARRTNGASDPIGAASPTKPPTLSSRSPGSSHAAGKASISSLSDAPSEPLSIPATTAILTNPLSAQQAASLSSAGHGSGSLVGPANSGSKGTLQTFDIDDMISRLLDAGYSAKVTKSVALKNAEITAVCQAAREVFLSQPTLLELSPPVKIVGDVHGQYTDLIRLFEMCGFPPASNYLFLGDYVDRGKMSLETILLLLCYKIKYPENFFLLRGNHECANVTRVYGFYDECKRRCNIKVWKTFIDVFNCLPIAGIVASKIFCVHGGLSPSLTQMDDIRRLTRPSDVPDYGLLNDLLWSDPSDTALDWEDNERGVSYCFGKQVIGDFLARYDFDLICRAHMVVEDGYEFWNERTLVTIFSAPNYCGEFDNHGAVMSVSEDLLCSFELLKPLDNAALKKEMARGRRRASAAAQDAAAAAGTTAGANGATAAVP